MITDQLLDWVFAAIDFLTTEAESLFDGLPIDGLTDLSTGLASLTPLFSILANFMHLSIVGGALAFVATWESAYVLAKVALKVYRLIPFKAT